jgi:UDP-2,4-diacetamido-2,4,6-trideoxy-beta-L-altropyranose hydrolase
VKLAFRLDSSPAIGLGHLKRCLSIANYMSEHYQAECLFLCSRYANNQSDLIANAGHQFIFLHEHTVTSPQQAKTETWLATTEQQDSQLCIEKLLSIWPQGADVLIVDHYRLTHHWHIELSPFCGKLVVIDDLCDKHYCCDVLVDQSIGRQASDYELRQLKPSTLLTGISYALVPEAFQQQALYSNCHFPPKILLISLGATDANNLTGKVLTALENININDLKVLVVLTSAAPFLTEVEKQINASQLDVELHIDVESMLPVLATTDVAIGASGTSVIERAIFGIPTILYVTADNQRFISEQLVNNNIVLGGETHHEFSESSLKDMLEQLISDQACFQALSSNSKTLCDGLGLERIAVYLLDNTKLSCQLATVDDAKAIYNIQSQQDIRQYFLNPATPKYSEHIEWMQQATDIKNNQLFLYVIRFNDGIAGCVRIDNIDEKTYEVSIILDTYYHGKGIASKTLKQIVAKFSYKTLLATIHTANTASKKLFEGQGFYLSNQLNEHFSQYKRDVYQP